MKPLLLILSLFFSLISVSYADTMAEGKYAIIDTSQGKIIIKLMYEKTPLTVINFAGLALGTKNNTIKTNKPFYDGLKFHRVIDNFMIQGGDPKGNGTGGPGYKFIDEITDLKHNKPGTLSMANSGSNTNGSQFFITHRATPWLDGKHTVFGYVTKGMDVINNIKKNDIIKSITIKNIGKKAQEFLTTEANFQILLKKLTTDKYKKTNEQLAKFIKKNIKGAVKYKNYYRLINKQINTKKPNAGDLVKLNLGISLASGKIIQEKKDIQLAAGRGKLLPILEQELMQLSVGSTITLYVPYYAIYGDQKTSIAQDAIIIFNLILKEIN